MDFPPEVLQNIFIFLDGASLVKCRRVCSLWLREADRCELVPDFWKQRCIEEVSRDFLPSYIAKINPIYFEDNSVALSWKNVYICWYRWKLIGKWPSKVRELDIKRPGQIIRAEFYGNWIVYSTSDYNTVVACHMEYPAISGKILYEGARLKYFEFISSPNPSRLPFSVVFVSTERDSCFVDVRTGRVIGDFEVFSDDTCLCEIIESKRDRLRAINPDKEDLEPPFTLPKNIDNFNLHVVGVSEGNGVLYETVQTKTRWLILNHKAALGISKTPDILRHVVVFVVGEKRRVYYPSINFGSITAALLHGNNLFLGTSNATLHHYTIKNINDLLNFNFFQHDWSIRDEVACMRYECIRSIDVCELYRRPCLALATGPCRIVIVDFLGDDTEAEELYFPNVLPALN